MRSTAWVVVFLFLPGLLLAGTTQSLIFDRAGLDVPPIEKLSADMSQTSLSFKMAGLETEEVAMDGIEYEKIDPISGAPERFGRAGEEGLPDLPVLSQL